MDTLERLYRAGVVPVVEIPDHALAVPLADALLEAGIAAIEITFRTPAGAASLAAIRRERPGMLAGAGTILRPGQLDDAIASGAQFMMTPGYSETIVGGAQAAGIPIFPGITTATEVQTALEAGLDVVKLYPAELAGGVPYIKALGAPFPEMRFVPSGGIGLAQIDGYLRLRNVLAVGGSWMVRKEWLTAGDLDAVRTAAGEAAAAVKAVRR